MQTRPGERVENLTGAMDLVTDYDRKLLADVKGACFGVTDSVVVGLSGALLSSSSDLHHFYDMESSN